jgi:hypothetical protein
MVFAGLLILVLCGCNNLTGSGADFREESIPKGKGLARITLGGAGARTVVPNIEGYYFTLKFTADGKDDVDAVLDGGTDITVALEPADWTLEAKGYTDSSAATLKVTGSASGSVTMNNVSDFVVSLMPNFNPGGTGNLTYNIEFPASMRVWFGLYPLDASGAGEEIDITSSPWGVATGTLSNLPAGAYQAIIDIYGADNKAAVWTTVVHIDDNATTSLTRTFSRTDFADCDPVVGENKTTLAAKLDAALASPAGSYTIVLGRETDLAAFAPKTLKVTGNKNITITIRGNGKTVQLRDMATNNGSLFALGADPGSTLTLIVQDLTIKGKANNNDAPLVTVNSGGTLELRAGSSITGNTAAIEGGGVLVSSGTFTMTGGAVIGNTASGLSGGGVYVSNGTFTMSGGMVTGNTADGYAGGVYINTNGTFTMTGGAVAGNNTANYGGGGVYVPNGTFTMSGGAVTGNTSSDGGGVYVNNYGTFDMNGGAVTGNTAAMGGGVLVYGIFTMNGGAVRGNSLSGGYGREVLVDGAFMMSKDAQPERVFLNKTNRFITITGTDRLSGGPVFIDLGIGSAPLTNWVGKKIIFGQFDREQFTLGNATDTAGPYTETPIQGYEIVVVNDDGGYFRSN